MKNKKLLAIVLLSLSFCFVSGAGYGEVKKWLYESLKTSRMESYLLEARIDYIMLNPTIFLKVDFDYDSEGGLLKDMLPKLITTKGKIIITVKDIRGLFSDKSGIALLDTFKRYLEVLYSFVQHIATDMNDDIVALFYTREEIPLGYFYQGKYHLWED